MHAFAQPYPCIGGLRDSTAAAPSGCSWHLRSPSPSSFTSSSPSPPQVDRFMARCYAFLCSEAALDLGATLAMVDEVGAVGVKGMRLLDQGEAGMHQLLLESVQGLVRRSAAIALSWCLCFCWLRITPCTRSHALTAPTEPPTDLVHPPPATPPHPSLLHLTFQATPLSLGTPSRPRCASPPSAARPS